MDEFTLLNLRLVCYEPDLKQLAKKKHIAFVIGALTPGGAERVISTLCNGMIENFHITIITFKKSTPFYRLDDRIKVISCFDKIDKPASVFGSIKLNYNILKKVTTIVKNEKIDLLIGFITSANIIATLAARRNGIPCLISERNDPLKKDIPRFWVMLRKLVYPKADNLIVQTEKVKTIYTKKLKCKNITVLPNPISSDLTKLRKNDVIREKIILTVGRLNSDKRQDKLIRAVDTLKLEGWKVIIIGKGPNKKKLTNLIESLHLSDQIEILSNIKNIQDYYLKASIFVFTSKSEGFPNALLEAMHFGLPCISTDCNYGPSDILTNGKDGFLVPVNDQELLVEKIDELIKDNVLRNYLAKNAEQTSLNFTSDKVISQWEKLINYYLKN